ncbi:hypothetical protein HY992_05640 [Candidatus Micrarchaeota archaeon]|nr:hypothetical protein [Candidatus Micrarchaeota archaeon]
MSNARIQTARTTQAQAVRADGLQARQTTIVQPGNRKHFYQRRQFNHLKRSREL